MLQFLSRKLFQLSLSVFILISIGVQHGMAQNNVDPVQNGSLHLDELQKTNIATLNLSLELAGNSVSLHPEQMVVDKVSRIDGTRKIFGHEKLSGVDINYTVRTHQEGGVTRLTISANPAMQESVPTLNLVLQQNPEVSLPHLFGLANMYSFVRPIVLDNSNQFDFIAFLEEENSSCDGCWAGYRTQYHALLISGGALTISAHTATEDGAVESMELAQAMMQNNIGGSVVFSSEILIYNSPIEHNVISQIDDESLMNMMYAHLWDWVRYIVFALRALLYFLFSLLGNWGLAIILLAFCIRLFIIPVSELASKYQRETVSNQQLLKPFIAEIKSQYKGEEQSNKLFELYEKHDIHPLSGFKAFFGLAVQIPIFIAIFALLGELQPIVGTPFLWITDLSLPDALFGLPFTIPLLGDSFNLLPFIMTLITVILSLLFKEKTMTAEALASQQRNMYFIAAAFFFLFYPFPAAFVLYWSSSTFFQGLQQLLSQKYRRV